MSDLINNNLPDGIREDESFSGKDLEDIVKAVLATREALTENPHNTTQGQVPISQAESYWARKLREGEFKTSYTDSASVTDPAFDYVALTAPPDSGYKALPIKLIFSADTACHLRIRTKLGNAAETDTYQELALQSAGTVQYDFPEGLEFLSSGNGNLIFYLNGTGTINYKMSVSYVQVAE